MAPVKPRSAMLLHYETALLPTGWARNVVVTVRGGRILSVDAGVAGQQTGTLRAGVLLAAPVNLHSHTFQRAMAGLTERRGPGGDSFWTWRSLMYRFLERLTPDDVQTIAAMAMVEMAEAGFGALAEFHYLHHAPQGVPYADPAEMAGRIVAAAAETGLGLTLLPVLYTQGGCDGRPLQGGQLRFGTDLERFLTLQAEAGRGMAADGVLGVAPHSLRAVSRGDLAAVAGLAGPLHLHLAEQAAEVAEVQAAYGARPVEWLLHNADVDARWCAIHATQMEAHETMGLSASGAVAGLCPVTEANLGDGIFDGVRFAAAGGRFGVGSDSNVRISLCEELRGLEYSQRLAGRGRAMLATADRSTGRALWDGACAGGAQAAGRGGGAIAVGEWADLLVLDTSGPDMAAAEGDTLLDTFIFAGDDRMVTDLWSAGRHIVTGGRHVAREAVISRYRAAIARLRADL